jgi:hypothetical protein
MIGGVAAVGPASRTVPRLKGCKTDTPNTNPCGAAMDAALGAGRGE